MGVCVRPIPVRRVDRESGATKIVDVPCGGTLGEVEAAIERVEAALVKSGVRGKPAPCEKPRRVRSTRRRQDVPELPSHAWLRRRWVAPRQLRWGITAWLVRWG